MTDEEKFIIQKLKEKVGNLNYKALQIPCNHQIEGVRLILKKLKESEIDTKILGFSI